MDELGHILPDSSFPALQDGEAVHIIQALLFLALDLLYDADIKVVIDYALTFFAFDEWEDLKGSLIFYSVRTSSFHNYHSFSEEPYQVVSDWLYFICTNLLIVF